MKSGRWILAVAGIVASSAIFAAEMTPLGSKGANPTVAPPPEVNAPAVPPAPKLGSIPATVAPVPETQAVAPLPRTNPPAFSPDTLPANPLISQDRNAPAPVTPRSETVPDVSQPLTGVPAETIAQIEKQVEEEGMYFNVADEDIREVIKQISRALGKNFLLDDKVKGKISIISERKMTKDEIWEAFQSALEVIGYTLVQGPAGLLRFVPTKEAIQSPIDFYTEDTPFTDRFITRLITLKNISATDMSNAIKGMVSKEGNLFAYPVTNTLIITDTGTNIDRLVRLIQQLDREGPQEVMEIIAVLYADAKDVAAKISQIYDADKGQAAAPRPRRAGGKDEEDEKAIRKIIPDERTNSLIVLASKRAIQDIHDLVKQLDVPLTKGSGVVHVYYLNHARAKDIAAVLSALSGQVGQTKGDAQGNKTGAAPIASLTGASQFFDKWSVTADESNNALVITAAPKDYDTLINSVIAKLDIPRRQVYVEAVIVELSVSQDQQLGTGAIGGKSLNLGGADLALFGSTFGFLDPTKLLSGAIGAGSNDTNTINTPSSTGGAANSISVPGFFTALQMTQGNTEVNILSTPNILTLDNEEAEIKVGQKIPFPSGTATTIGGSFQTTFTREDVALTLKIKPQISESDTIRMQVEQTDREVLPNQQQAVVASGGGPATTERSLKTSIVATNHQTIVLGGLIKDKNTTVTNKIPLLGDIPVLGYLFKTRQKNKQKVNLVVFLTPHIIHDARDFLAILEKKIDEKNAFISENFSKAQQKQIHRSLEVHASQLLKYTGPNAQYTDEEKFPIGEISPTYTPAEPVPAAPVAVPATKKTPPVNAPPYHPEEDIDLAP